MLNTPCPRVAQTKKKRPEGRFWLQIRKDQKLCLMPTAKVFTVPTSVSFLLVRAA
jgi:hypothetical protein